MQDYQALAALWQTLSGADIWEKLDALNATMDGDVSWAEAHGWHGIINQNDLVPAGLITDDERVQAELAKSLITAQEAQKLMENN